MEDNELEKIKKKQLEELLHQQNLNKIVNEIPVMELTSNDFDQKKSENELLLVDFWAEWCGPCKSIAPALEEISEEMKSEIVIAKLNVDENPATAQEYNIRSIPALMIFKGGEVKAEMMGALPKSQLENWIKENI